MVMASDSPHTADLIAAVEQIYQKTRNAGESDSCQALVSAIGTAFSCARVNLFERRTNGSFELVSEFCRAGTASSADYITGIENDQLKAWQKLYGETENEVFFRKEAIQKTDPALYRIMENLKTDLLIGSTISYRGSLLGILFIDSPQSMNEKEISGLFSILRPYLSEMMFNRKLHRLLNQAGFIDSLTGAGTRLALNDLLERMPSENPFGVLLVDLIGLKRINDTEGHHVGNQKLKMTADVLGSVFNPNYVFRFEGGTFLVMVIEPGEEKLYQKYEEISALLDQKKVETAIVVHYEPRRDIDFDVLIRRLSLRLHEQKRILRSNITDNAANGLSGRSLIMADLVSHTITALFCPPEDRLEGNLESIMEKRLESVHPEDQDMFRDFWNEHEIRGRFRLKPTESHAIVFRVLKNGNYIWVQERMELLERNESVFRILLTIEKGDFLENYTSVKESVPMEAEHARAGLTMYRNREFFHRASAWQSQNPSGKTLMIAMDINHFKLYNSIFGIKAGNRVLQMMQDLLLQLSRQHHGISGYMGNDNFVLMVPQKEDTTEESVRAVEEVMRSVDVPALFLPHAGIYVSHDRYELPSEQYEWASLALDQISGNTNDLVAAFDRKIYEQRRQEQLLLIDIEQGILDDEFTFYLQPKVNMHTGRLLSFEALVRWIKDGRVIPPSVFVDPMEKYGTIHTLDMIVLRKVCEWLKERIDQNLPVIPVSVNLSRADFSAHNIADLVEKTIRSYNLPPHLIQVEITESTFFEDDRVIRRNVNILHDSGHNILLDDFGKGYSSYTSLSSMSLDVLKLDKKFIDDLNKEEDRRIVETIIRMAHMIGLLVIAEGVETKEQADLLINLNCYYCQGYYFYRPMPAREAGKLIENTNLIQSEHPFIAGMRFGSLSFAQLVEEKYLTASEIDHIIGPLAIFEVTDSYIHILQMNTAYADILSMQENDKEGRETFMEDMAQSEEEVRNSFAQADLNPGYSSTSGYHRSDGTEILLKASIYPISKTENARFYLVSLKSI